MRCPSRIKTLDPAPGVLSPSHVAAADQAPLRAERITAAVSSPGLSDDEASAADRTNKTTVRTPSMRQLWSVMVLFLGCEIWAAWRLVFSDSKGGPPLSFSASAGQEAGS